MVVRMCVQFVTRNVGSQGLSQDRVGVFSTDAGVAIALADGAGNSSDSGMAAETVVEIVRAQLQTICLVNNKWDLCNLLCKADESILRSSLGETTAVICGLCGSRLIGASIGDSEAWLIEPDCRREITSAQHRKPLLGSGSAVPTPFESREWGGTLLVATDGLLKYAHPDQISEAARLLDLNQAADALLAAVRLRSGQYNDDVCFALCRRC